MMTTLCEMIMECRAIAIDDRVVLYGWAAQLEEGNDTLYCSKETVAEFIGLGISTIQRRTKRLLGSGLLLDTGEQKQWSKGWTPVYSINVPIIVGLIEAQPFKLNGHSNRTAVQIDRQGSRFGSRFGSRSGSRFTACSTSTTTSTATGVPPVVAGESKEGGKPENLKTAEPTPTPKPEPNANPTPKPSPAPKNVCSKCGEPLKRDENHLLVCRAMAKGNHAVEASKDDTPDAAELDNIQRAMAEAKAQWDASEDEDDFGRCMREQREKQEREKQASHAQPPVAPAPLTPSEVCKRYTGDEIWDERGRTRDTPAGRAWAASRGEEIIRESPALFDED